MLVLKPMNLSTREDSGIFNVGVKSKDIKRNTRGEGDYLDRY